MKKIVYLFFTASLFASFLWSCRDEKKTTGPQDSPKQGTINVSVDESFAPVIKAQIDMYEASFPGTHIIAHFKAETDCLKDLFRDTATRMVIVTRGLTDREERILSDSLGYTPGWNAVASDAVAIVLNKNNADSTFTLAGLQDLLTGKMKNLLPVFDGLNETSTVRFIRDSILKGKALDSSVVRGLKNSSEVLDYVAGHENAVGFVGINRIGNPEDSGQVNLLKKIKIAYVQCDLCHNKPFVFPSQESILSHRYPLVRGLYYIVKENYTGLGSGFAAFLRYERGQLIFRRAYLGPVMDFIIRSVNINEHLPAH